MALRGPFLIWARGGQFRRRVHQTRPCKSGANIAGRDEPVRATVSYVTGGLLPMLGVPPALGRLLSVDDDRPNAPGAAVLSYDLWQRAYGGDPHVLSRDVRLDGHSTRSRPPFGEFFMSLLLRKATSAKPSSQPGPLLPLQRTRAGLRARCRFVFHKGSFVVTVQVPWSILLDKSRGIGYCMVDECVAPPSAGERSGTGNRTAAPGVGR